MRFQLGLTFWLCVFAIVSSTVASEENAVTEKVKESAPRQKKWTRQESNLLLLRCKLSTLPMSYKPVFLLALLRFAALTDSDGRVSQIAGQGIHGNLPDIAAKVMYANKQVLMVQW